MTSMLTHYRAATLKVKSISHLDKISRWWPAHKTINLFPHQFRSIFCWRGEYFYTSLWTGFSIKKPDSSGPRLSRERAGTYSSTTIRLSSSLSHVEDQSRRSQNKTLLSLVSHLPMTLGDCAHLARWSDSKDKCALCSLVLDQYVPQRNHYFILNKAADYLLYKYLQNIQRSSDTRCANIHRIWQFSW